VTPRHLAAVLAAEDPYGDAGASIGTAFWLILLLLLAVGVVGAAGFGVRRGMRERRAIARLREPADPRAGVTPQVVSNAVSTFVWGLSRDGSPGSHPDAVRTRFGSSAPFLLTEVERYLDAARQAATAGGVRDDVAREIASQAPELSHDAADSLAAWALTDGPR
jgi:hypothetical protein